MHELRGNLYREASVLLSAGNAVDAHPASTFAISPKEESVAAWAYQNRQPA